jgi:hypothetical protein
VSDAYYLPALGPVLLLMGSVVDSLGRRAGAAAAVAVVALMAVSAGVLVNVNATDVKADKVRRGDFAFVKTFLGSSQAMMDGGHVFRHYVSATQIQDLSYNSTSLLARRRGKYIPLTYADYKGKVVGILADRTDFLHSDAARQLTATCPQTVRPTVVLWDCRQG